MTVKSLEERGMPWQVGHDVIGVRDTTKPLRPMANAAQRGKETQ
jgi:hypothetical protein